METATHAPSPSTYAPASWRPPVTAPEVVYPDSDGKPMADNSVHYDWITLLKSNLDQALPDFVAGDMFWYPLAGRPKVRTAPDVLVALGRPKGPRRSYRQFEEDGVPPTVVFEVLSPDNSAQEMTSKALFALSHGARELIVIDPPREDGYAFLARDDGEHERISSLDGWTSPTLGVRFAREDGQLVVYRPDGSRFIDYASLEAERAEEARLRAGAEARATEEARLRAEEARLRAEAEARATEAEARYQRLAALLTAQGLSADEG